MQLFSFSCFLSDGQLAPVCNEPRFPQAKRRLKQRKDHQLGPITFRSPHSFPLVLHLEVPKGFSTYTVLV